MSTKPVTTYSLAAMQSAINRQQTDAWSDTGIEKLPDNKGCYTVCS